MWAKPETHENPHADTVGNYEIFERPDLSAENLAHYIRLGQTMRSQAMRDFMTRVGMALRNRFGRKPVLGAEAPVLSDIADRLAGPLTSIRSSAEILRDHPDIAASERGRFVDIVLAEEARIETLVAELLGNPGNGNARPSERAA
ncbi:histidine kinase dimerization/phospho-acceptor domain-containing protein [Oceanibacterium hippocampi]|uniref:histidine kinase n=1 Tax=Oceanibacterium hippocampi TaxID=745714 RepID=A0A1Y5U2T2_9PROT|nr:histidine kinase dimerization/phospho-acceptor domain-containing protein [Oceanibacterium hippocampi]SLN75797.1 sensory histidine kinase CreC [Oceanibacterium hippocampi]